MKDKGDSISCLFSAELLWRRISVPVQEAELCYRGVHGVRDHVKCPCCSEAGDGSVQHSSKISPTSGFGSRRISSLGDGIILSFPLPWRLAESKGASHVHEVGVKNDVEKNLSGASMLHRCLPQPSLLIPFQVVLFCL